MTILLTVIAALPYTWLCGVMKITQLHKACGGLYGILLGYTGNGTEVLRLVYVKGHKINVQDNKGNTPLHCGCFNGHREIAETLMLAGVDETIKRCPMMKGRLLHKWLRVRDTVNC